VSAPKAVLASSYVYPCQADPTTDYQNTVDRGQGLGGTGSDYHAVIGEVYLESVSPCTSPNTVAISAVLPANLQVSGTSEIVQLGWGNCTVVPPNTACGDPTFPIPADGHVHFIYICSDVSGGAACNADHWAGSPVIGHRYRFEVAWSSAGWVYTIKDYNTGVSKSATIPEDWEFGNGAWWGGEAYDPQSMLGPTSVGSQLQMYWMQYLRTATGSSWQVAEPVSLVHCVLPYPYTACSGTWPSHFGGKVYSQNYTNDAVDVWTTAY
jgi:hypothetical protein